MYICAEYFYSLCHVNYREERDTRLETYKNKNPARCWHKRHNEGKLRNCLKCGVKFKSAGNGNRLCSNCRHDNNRASHIAGMEPFKELMPHDRR